MSIRRVSRRRASAGVASLIGVAGISLVGTPVAAARPESASPATVSGTAKIKGAPSGWQNAGFYVQACPSAVPFSDGCRGGRTATPSSAPGPYAVRLAAGSWNLGLYYYTEHGQIINNTSAAIALTSGQQLKHNLAVAYETPAAGGTVHLTGAPKNFNAKAYMGVQGCPAGETGCTGGTEAYEGIGPGQPYSIDLSPGSWTIYAYYRQDGTNQTFTGKRITITATAGQTVHMDLSIAYQGL